jgi:glycine/D-amino acid oxidase-like deaminating enzyme
MDGWLTAVGGPEGPLEGAYDPQVAPRPESFDRLERFMDETLISPPGVRDHRWQGLMGYTRTGVRSVGRDPLLPSLFYDLGCNGIGLLSAVAGAKRLANIMNGFDVEPSMFDPEISLVAKKEVVNRTR